jgi:hypothetical protein
MLRRNTMNGTTILIIAVMGSIGLVTLVGALLFIYYENRQIAQGKVDIQWLRENGTRITAFVENVTTTDYSKVAEASVVLDVLDGGASTRQEARDVRNMLSSSPSYRVIARGMYPPTQKYYTFERSVGWDELPKHYTPGSDVSFEVSVLIDPKNPKRYYMELPSSS